MLEIQNSKKSKKHKNNSNENDELEGLTNKEIVLKMEEHIKLIKQLKQEEHHLNNLLFRTDAS